MLCLHETVIPSQEHKNENSNNKYVEIILLDN